MNWIAVLTLLRKDGRRGMPPHLDGNAPSFALLQAVLLLLFSYSSDNPVDLGGIGLLNSEFGGYHTVVYAIVHIRVSSSILHFHPYLHYAPIIEDDIKRLCHRQGRNIYCP